MTKEEAFKELEDHIITSISSLENKHININVAKRVIEELLKSTTCDGCTFNFRISNYDMDTGERLDDLFSKECYECSRNTRPCDDKYKPKGKE